MKETDLVNLNVKMPRGIRDKAKELAGEKGMKLASYMTLLIVLEGVKNEPIN